MANKILTYLDAASTKSANLSKMFPDFTSVDNFVAQTDLLCISSLHPQSPARSTRLRAPIVNAILGSLSGQNPDPIKRKNCFTVVRNSAGMYSCEQPILDSTGQPTGDYVLAVLTNSKFEVAEVVNAGATFSQFPAVGRGTADDAFLQKHPLDGVFAMCLFTLMDFHQEAVDDFNALKDSLELAGQGGTEALNALSADSLQKLYRLCDAVYWAVQGDTIKLTVTAGNIRTLRQQDVTSGALFTEDVLCGWTQPMYLFGANTNRATVSTGTVTFGSAKEIFKSWRETLQWTEEERKFIPEFPDDFIVMPEAIQLAKLFVNTHNNKRPMVNFMWRGITSYGKSTGVSLVAALLDTPLLRMTCHTDMETQNFLSEFVPDTGGQAPKDVPSFDEISYDPESAYEKLTGEYVEGITPQQCLDAFAEAMQATGREGGTARYKIVEANFVKALARGYICEIQELSRIRDSGVLVGLNEYDHPGAFIPLVDGRFVQRHPNAMVIYTDNVGYASCRPIDPSVLRRMAYIIDSYDMPKEKVIERVVYNTGFDDMDMLDKMYNLWCDIDKHCKKREITEGCVSVTELEMWCQTVMAEGKTVSSLKEACMRCVVAKATSVIDEQDELKEILDTSPLF